MALVLDDKWVWDFWFARDEDEIHIFYLQADRALKEEHLRHWHVSIGHAVTTDLIHWDILPDALHPSSDEADFDSYTTWTGSIIQRDGLWYMFYTGGKKSEGALIQRIGLATSSDLTTWHKHDKNPLIEASPEWYELLDLDAWHDQAWRDPYVFQADDGIYHAFITARKKEGLSDARGVVGHAQSHDLLTWQVLPPIAEVDDFGYLEVPQLINIGAYYYLIFSCPREYYSKARQSNGAGREAIHYMIGDSALGAFRYDGGALMPQLDAPIYSGKLIRGFDGGWYLMGFHNINADGEFVGTISDPIPLKISPDGRLSV